MPGGGGGVSGSAGTGTITTLVAGISTASVAGGAVTGGTVVARGFVVTRGFVAAGRGLVVTTGRAFVLVFFAIGFAVTRTTGADFVVTGVGDEVVATTTFVVGTAGPASGLVVALCAWTAPEPSKACTNNPVIEHHNNACRRHLPLRPFIRDTLVSPDAGPATTIVIPARSSATHVQPPERSRPDACDPDRRAVRRRRDASTPDP